MMVKTEDLDLLFHKVFLTLVQKSQFRNEFVCLQAFITLKVSFHSRLTFLRQGLVDFAFVLVLF